MASRFTMRRTLVAPAPVKEKVIRARGVTLPPLEMYRPISVAGLLAQSAGLRDDLALQRLDEEAMRLSMWADQYMFTFRFGNLPDGTEFQPFQGGRRGPVNRKSSSHMRSYFLDEQSAMFTPRVSEYVAAQQRAMTLFSIGPTDEVYVTGNTARILYERGGPPAFRY